DSAMKCPQCGRELRKPQRGLFGKIFLWVFYIFNAFMLLWVIGGYMSASEIQTTTEAERIGASIGTGLGLSMLFGLWVVGDIITGLLALMTRPKS
ncbi:MAG: hypothetical protein IJR94_00125, partial [Synergistaceae bacterium]|nr:hypothetical protein [Synergistaceae bacterium]